MEYRIFFGIIFLIAGVIMAYKARWESFSNFMIGIMMSLGGLILATTPHYKTRIAILLLSLVAILTTNYWMNNWNSQKTKDR